MTIRVSLAAALIVAAGIQVRSSAGVLRALLHPESAVDLPFEPPLLRPVLEGVSPEGARAGLRDGDVVRDVDGAPFTGRDVLARALAGKRPGDLLPLLLAEDATRPERHANVPVLQRYPTHWSMALVLGLAVPAFCLLLGFGVAAVRPRDPLAWVLLWLMISFSRIGDSGTASLLEAGPGVWFYDVLFGQSWALAIFVFGLLFPERLAFDRRHPWAKWILIVPIGLLSVLDAVRAGLSATSFALAGPLDRALVSLGTAPLLLRMLAIGLFFSSIGVKWGTAKSADSRRRLRLLLAGAALALTPPFLLLLASLVSGNAGFSGFPPWAIAAVLLCLALFPLTLAYVIVVERAMDLRVVVRQGLQYGFARNGITALRIVVSLLLVLGAVTLASDPSRNRPRRIIPLAAGFAFVVIVGRVAERLHRWTDRRFFREAYDAERILNELSERVRTMVEADPLLETVTRTISESLHVPRVAVLLSGGHGLGVVHATGGAPGPGARLGPTSHLVERLRAGEPVRVYLDAGGRGRQDPALEAARPALQALGAELLLPLSVKEELLGVLSLGPKLSEEPYSPSDVRLLRSVATQTSLALQNSRLTEAIAAEVARRERMNRELEIAHEVQEGLFPQSYPKIPELDLAGHCRPARGVGGDYYDFVVVANGGVGIAIGDIAGKGIPAALLMAGLQASLRSQAIAAPPDLPTLMSNLNRLICESSPANRYATFFYGEYDPRTRRLAYVNAGHNAPMLFRRGAREAIRLEAGGPVIGLLEGARFEQGGVDLEPGDLFIGFTDGVSEAMNARSEEWGEVPLAETVLACRGLPAASVIARIMQAADAFVAGAVQHDDMTLIVVRVAG